MSASSFSFNITDYIEQLFNRDTFTVSLNAALEKVTPEKSRFFSVTIPFKSLDPLAILEIFGEKKGFQFYWEHPVRELAMAASGSVAVFKATGTHRFEAIEKKINAFKKRSHSYSEHPHTLAGPHFFGGGSFFDKSLSGAWAAYSNASFTLPHWVFTREGRYALLTITLELNSLSSTYSVYEDIHEFFLQFNQNILEKLSDYDALVTYPAASQKITQIEKDQDFKSWKKNIEKARDLITGGIIEKIVLAREVRVQTQYPVSATRFVHQLRKDYPACYNFLYQLNDQSVFLGSTPEKLISLQSRYLCIDGLAGSISRGNTATQDAILENKLLASNKDQEEHKYVVDAIRSKLSKYTKDIELPLEPSIRKYANVQHLYTPISASLTNDVSPLALIDHLHPTPAVGGYPQTEALSFIQELEQIERGWYAGPIGWFNENGMSEFAVALRCGLIQNQKIRFFAGCGIVEDSDPGQEWEETKLKLKPMLNALEHAAE